MSTESYHTAVWIDHREARIFHFDRSNAEKSVIRSDNPDMHIHHKINVIGSGHAAEDQDFYHRVSTGIAGAQAILITGPANAKTELIKHIHRHEPLLVEHIVGVETVDHPSAGLLGLCCGHADYFAGAIRNRRFFPAAMDRRAGVRDLDCPPQIARRRAVVENHFSDHRRRITWRADLQEKDPVRRWRRGAICFPSRTQISFCATRCARSALRWSMQRLSCYCGTGA